MCMSLCEYMHMCARTCEGQKTLDNPGAGDKGSCALPHMGARNQTQMTTESFPQTLLTSLKLQQL